MKLEGTVLSEIRSVQFSLSVMFDSLQPHELPHARLPHPSPSPRVYSTHVHWIDDAIQPSHLLSSPSLPAFNLSQQQGLFQLVRFSHYVAKLLELQHHWDYSGLISLRLTGLISLLSKGLSRVFSSTTVRKHQFLSAQPSLWSNSHLRDYWKNHSLTRQTLLAKQCLCFLTFINNNVSPLHSLLHSLLFHLKPLPIDYIHQNAGFEWLMSSNLYRHWKSEVKIILIFTF